MGWFFIIIVAGLVAYWLISRSKKDSPSRPVQRVAEHPAETLHEMAFNETNIDEESDRTVSYREIPQVAVDLRKDAERLFRIVGSGYWVEPGTTPQYPLSIFFLHREPDNEHDKNAIGVYGGDRKFGYLSASAAAQYAPLLDQIGSHFIVRRNYEHYTGNSFYLPYIPVLRGMTKDKSLEYWNPNAENLETETEPRTPLSDPDETVTSGYPLIGGPHNNGDRVFGYYGERAAELQEKGAPKVSSLKKSSLTPAIQDVRISDKLTLKLVDKTLVALKAGKEIGALNWTDHHDRFDGGTLEVQRVFVSSNGKVSNCGGIAIPATFPNS